MATFNDLSDEQLGKLLRSRYDRLCAAHDMGLSEQHPSERWAEDTETLKAYREAAATGGIAGKVAGSDNPPATPGTPKPPVAGADGRFMIGTDGVPRFEAINAKGDTVSIVTGDAAVEAHARQSDPARVRRMAKAIGPSYDRLK
jgi:hypothetical protein